MVDILLVDDRPENLVALKAILDAPEYNLVTAASGAEALRHILRNNFAVVLLDVLMPGMDGFEVASLIKQREPSAHIPIIFLTAVGKDMNFIYKGYSIGAVDYLVKPVDPDLVRAKVAVFVELFRRGEQIKEQAEKLREIERRERALQLQELRSASERRYQSLADAIPQIVWRADASGAADYFNRRWREYTGIEFDVAHGAGWLDALHPSDRARCEAEWHAVVRSGAEQFQTECRLRRADDGVYRWHLWRSVPERLHHGETVAWLGTLTDIDDHKRAEEERTRLYHEAQSAVRVRDEFLSIASHELKTPITTLKLHVTTLLRNAARGSFEAFAPEKLVPRLDALHTQVNRLTGLVDNLLDVSRITAGRIDLELADVDLSALVQEISERTREDVSRAGSVLSVSAEPRVVGRWDSMRLDQVVTNLLSNAVKYGAGKPIEVRVQAVEARARVTVRDHGIGISPSDQDRIFQRFERAVSERQFGGFGLGLWIVRQIVEALGGQISVASEPGLGSTFTVDLPLGHAAGVETGAQSAVD